ncbi:MAG TPA: SDR family NAD(P)-dependent oxidoreductase, partial [Gammaproteobacteria bacterium]|nr:SDR family NAD(P)-dependent oxidoreductase [Gammaproteobacteria bacterium]
MKLTNRAAIITGASQGLGVAIAKQFISEGAHVMLCARNEADLQKAQHELAALAPAGVMVLAMPADIADLQQMHALT